MDTTTPTKVLGEYGERLAARFLAEQGYTILDRNWRCVRGEIDIVARDGADVVICEVKTRTSELFGAPFEAVTRTKLRRLRGLGGLWRDARPEDQRPVGPLRIDVVSILRPATGPAVITHLVGVS